MPDPNFEERTAKLATVEASKAVFHDEFEKPTKSYVLKGDEVIVGEDFGGFVCGTYISRKGVETSGWLKKSEVNVYEIKPPKLEDWLGDWTSGKWQNLTLKPGSKPGWIDVSGMAYWAASEENAKNGGLNQGEVYGEGLLENGVVGYTMTEDEISKPWSPTAKEDLDCAILVSAVSRNYLMVEDSGNCGGHNVRFWGFMARGKVEFE